MGVLARAQTNAEAARAEAARQARQREASVAERERRRNIERTHLEKEKAQLAHEQDMLYEEQARFDAQVRARLGGCWRTASVLMWGTARSSRVGGSV